MGDIKLLYGLHGNYLQRVKEINDLYDIYEGKQDWDTPQGLDYKPTKKITNITKKLIDTKARFMFGKLPFFDLKQIESDVSEEAKEGVVGGSSTYHEDMTQAKEDLLHDILEDNMFHKKLLKGKKDCQIAGRVAIKLWASHREGIRIIFSPAQEFITKYDEEDVDKLLKITFIYGLQAEEDMEYNLQPKDQRIKKQVWELVTKDSEGNNIEPHCILNEGIYDGQGKLVEMIYDNYNTKLDFIPILVVQNGGLTGQTNGVSDVAQLKDNQNAYNKLTSDDIDALRFNMFPEKVATDADGASLDNMVIAPGALIDLQSARGQLGKGHQAKLENLESAFSYGDKFETTVDRIKNDMHDTLEVPNISLESLKGLMTSGKSMRALYWGLIAVCEEDATEWEPLLKKMVEYIFRMIDVYNLYGERKLAQYETKLEITRTYPLQEDTDSQKKIDMEEVITEVRSRKAYMNKWGEYEDLDSEIAQIQLELDMFNEDVYTDMVAQVNEEDLGDDKEVDEGEV